MSFGWVAHVVVAAVLIGAASATAAPVVHAEATFAVKEELGIPYAEGVLCEFTSHHLLLMFTRRVGACVAPTRKDMDE